MPSENKEKKEEQEQPRKKNSDNNEKYYAKSKNNNEKRDKNKGNIPQQSSSPKNNQKNSNEKNNQGNNKKDAPKEDPKQKLKEQGAAAAMSALGVPVPLAQALAKPAVNKLNNKNNLLNEQQQMKQGQERLNNIRNIAGAMNESKKEKQEDDDEEQQPASLIDQAEDIKAKAKNMNGFIRFLKMIPKPILISISLGILVFFLVLIIFLIFDVITSGAMTMADSKTYIDENIEEVDNNNNSQPSPNQGTGKLGYPTDSRTISAGFPNYSSGKYHGGIDFPVSTGSNVYAAEAGEVIVKKELSYSYGYYLYIKHDNGLCTLYAHNSKLLVNEGDKVTKGQVIAKSGSTGNSTGPHCHFEVRTDCGVSGGSPSGTRVNPNNYLSE